MELSKFSSLIINFLLLKYLLNSSYIFYFIDNQHQELILGLRFEWHFEVLTVTVDM